MAKEVTNHALVTLRKSMGLLQVKQAEFAVLIGVAESTVSRWRNGHLLPTAELNMKLVLLTRALEQSSPKEVLRVLRTAEDETDRIIKLVHLGDMP